MLGKLRWVALALLGVGAWFAWTGWQARALWERLEAGGKTTVAVLETGEVKSGRRGSKSYSFEVSYTPEGGAPIRQTFAVTKAFVEARVRDDRIVEDECTVRYDPADPKVALIEGGSKDERSQLTIGLAMFVAGAIGSVFLFRPRAAAPATAAG
jgi:hypothetical protein